VAKKPKGNSPSQRKAAKLKVGRGNSLKSQATQFKDGGNANRAGRPKGSKNLATLIMNAANDQVVVTVEGKKRRISKSQAAAMQLATQAAGGNQKAIAKFLDWIDEIETREAAKRPEQFPLSALDLEVLQAVYERMKQCELGTQ
jgi:hypothetical protein